MKLFAVHKHTGQPSQSNLALQSRPDTTIPAVYAATASISPPPRPLPPPPSTFSLLSALDQARPLLTYISGPDGANSYQRRRLQNRASQRAFRERKIRHTEGLEAKLKELAEMHRVLRDAYQRKVDEVDTLGARVEKLNGKISMLEVSARNGGELFSDPDRDCEGGVIEVENENPLGWSFDGSELEMAFDWLSNYGDSTPAMSQRGDTL
jgi:galactokinase